MRNRTEEVVWRFRNIWFISRIAKKSNIFFSNKIIMTEIAQNIFSCAACTADGYIPSKIVRTEVSYSIYPRSCAPRSAKERDEIECSGVSDVGT